MEVGSHNIRGKWKMQGHSLTFIVVLHFKNIVAASSGITKTSLPQALFVQPGKRSRVTAKTSLSDLRDS